MMSNNDPKLARFFYNLEEEFREEEEFDPSESKSIKISLPLHKRGRKRDCNQATNYMREEETGTDSDPHDLDYEGVRGSSKFKRRRMTYSSTTDRSGTSKPAKVCDRSVPYLVYRDG